MEKTKKLNLNKLFKSPSAYSFYSSLICIGIGLVVGLIALFVTSPGDAFFEFGVMITGGIGQLGGDALMMILSEAAPLMLAGLAVLFAYKTGLFNIGAAGQYVMGSFGALIVAIHFKGHWTVAIIAAIIFGAIWGIIPALLKAFCSVSEVISGIMLNWIALLFTNYSYQTYLKDMVNVSLGSKTYNISQFNPKGKLPLLGSVAKLGNSSTFTIGIIIAIVVAIIIYVILNKTTLGYQLKASGLNKNATRYAGMNDRKNLIVTMAISGALAGLGAAVYYLSGLSEIVVQDSSALPAVPWNGIVVAFVSQLSPIGAIFVSLFISLISVGSSLMTQSIFPAEFGTLVTAIIVYLSGLTALIKILITKKKKKKKEKLENPTEPTPVKQEMEVK